MLFREEALYRSERDFSRYPLPSHVIEPCLGCACPDTGRSPIRARRNEAHPPCSHLWWCGGRLRRAAQASLPWLARYWEATLLRFVRIGRADRDAAALLPRAATSDAAPSPIEPERGTTAATAEPDRTAPGSGRHLRHATTPTVRDQEFAAPVPVRRRFHQAAAAGDYQARCTPFRRVHQGIQMPRAFSILCICAAVDFGTN